jgi:hypothetical protein
MRFELVKLCQYCKIIGIDTEATVNRRGYDLCVPCRDRASRAEIESDLRAEAHYHGQAYADRIRRSLGLEE